MSSMQTPREFGDVTTFEKVHIGLTLLKLPLVIGWSALTKPFVLYNRSKRWSRVLSDSIFRSITGSLNRVQIQYLTGPSSLVQYKRWTKAQNLPRVVEDVGEGAQLMWVGPKRTDKVILWLHGGAFLFPLGDFATTFWRYVQTHLKDRDQDVGVAILAYTLVPNAQFPTQLKQACKAIEHLFAEGLKPENLQLVGDSAGGNLIIQVLSHILHPLDDVPRLTLSGPIRGVYLMSPWTRISSEDAVHEFDGIDVVHSKHGADWGNDVLYGVPDSQRVYLEGSTVSDSWFRGINSVVSRVLISVGQFELLKNSTTRFNDVLAKHHQRTVFVIQNGGVHGDPFYDFAFGGSDPVVGELTPIIIDWLEDGFTE